jgi:hypothetical protein
VEPGISGESLRKWIKQEQIYTDSTDTYGSRRVHAELRLGHVHPGELKTGRAVDAT